MARKAILVWVLFALLIAPRSAPAQQVPIDPASTHIFPAGGQQGTVVPVRVGGELLPPHTKIQFWGAGVKAPDVLGERVVGPAEPSPRRDPRETPMAYPKEWQSTVEISADALPGQKLWRLSSGRGGTGARPFIVGLLPEVLESEPNSSPERAQAVSLPVTINGQIAGERDIDYFQFSAEPGDVITAEVAAARLGSPLETVVEIHDSRGQRMRVQELRAGGDPVLVFRAETGGEYRLFVANLSFRGGAEFVYRITLTRAPYVALVFPPSVERGATLAVNAYRAFGDGALTAAAELLPGVGLCGTCALHASRPAANEFSLDVRDRPCTVEREPNDTAAQALELSAETIVSGQLATTTDEDWYRFTAQREQAFAIDCWRSSKSSPALPVVSIVDASGAVVASAKSADAGDRVCRLDWRAPADGAFCVRVADLQQGAAGGPEFIYSLSVARGRPDFSLSAKTDFVNVVQGGRGELELTIERRGGFAGPVELHVEGLPPGTRVEPLEIPANQSAVKIAVVADADARPTCAALQLTGAAVLDGQRQTRPLVATHLGHDAEGVGLGPSTIANLQLTVAHKPVFKLYCSEAYQYAHRGTRYPYRMEVERLDGFDGPIHLEVADRQIKDLDGAMVEEMTVEPGRTSFMLPLYLPETMHINIQAHSNIYAQGYVSFVDRWGQQQSHLVVSTMRCMVRTLPPVAKLQSVDRGLTVRPGGTVDCRLEVVRTSNFGGPMQIELVGTGESPGFSAPSVTLQSHETKATVRVCVGSDVAPRAGASAAFRATGSLGNDTVVISETRVPLNFQ